MKPNDQSNYWQHTEEESREISQQATESTQPVQTQSNQLVQSQMVKSEAEQSESATQTAEATVPIEEQPVHWQAKEYLHHERNVWWFIIFGVVTVGLLAIAIFLMQAWSFVALIVVMAAAVLVLVYRPPRTLDYTLTAKGLYIGEKVYDFSEFKSFGVIKDGEEYSVALIPTKRFSPAVTVYFPEASGEQIVDMLGVRLPMETLHLDVIDRVVRTLRL